MRPRPLTRLAGTPRERLGSESMITRNRSKPRTARRRAGSLGHITTSPVGQRKITDIFRAQMKDNAEGEDEKKELFLKKQTK